MRFRKFAACADGSRVLQLLVTYCREAVIFSAICLTGLPVER